MTWVCFALQHSIDFASLISYEPDCGYIFVVLLIVSFTGALGKGGRNTIEMQITVTFDCTLGAKLLLHSTAALLIVTVLLLIWVIRKKCCPIGQSNLVAEDGLEPTTSGL